MEGLLITLVCLAVLAGPVGLILGIISLRRLSRLRRELGLADQASPTAPGRPAFRTAAAPAPTPTSSQPTMPGAFPGSEPGRTPAEQHGTTAHPDATPAAAHPSPPPPPPPPPSRRRPTLTVGFAEKIRAASVGATGGPSAQGTGRGMDLESILGGQWLTWIGVLAIFFGTAFFLAVDLGTHALAGLPQLLIGLAVAGAFCVIGRIWSRSKSLRFLGLGLLGGGVALLYMLAFAAYGIHHLVPPGAVFPLLMGVSIAGALLALDRNSLTVASLTLTGALLTPILLSQGEDSTFALLPYLVAVNLGAVLMGRRPGWAGLPLAAFVGCAILVSDWMDTRFTLDNRNFALITVGASWLIYALSPRLRRKRVLDESPETLGSSEPSAPRSSDERPGRAAPGTTFWSLARGLVIVANGLLFGLFCYLALEMDAAQYQGLALAVLAVAYLGISQYFAHSQQGTGVDSRAAVNAGIDDHAGENDGVDNHARPTDPSARMSFYTGIALAALAVPAQFDLSWVTLGWTALAAVLLADGVYRDARSHRLAGLAVLGLALIRVVMIDLPITKADPTDFRFLLNGEFLSGLAVTGILVWLAWAYRRRNLDLGTLERQLATPLVLVGTSILWWKVTVEMLAWWELREFTADADLTPQLLASISLFWTLYAGAVVAIGWAARFRPLRQLGLALAGIALLKVVLWDSFTGRDPALGLQPFFDLPFLAGLALAMMLAALAWGFRQNARRVLPDERRLPTPLFLTALCALIWVISAEILYLFAFREHLGLASSERQSLLTLSLVWALYSGALIATGFMARFKALRLLGITLLAITILKVFVVDLTTLEKGYRIAAFVGLGVLVLAVSLLYQKRRPREDNPDSDGS